MAAWLAVRSGDKAAGLATLKSLLVEKSYSALTALNIIDWLGEDAAPLVDFIKETGYNKKVKSYEARMANFLGNK